MPEGRQPSQPIAGESLVQRMNHLLLGVLPSWAYQRGPPISWMTVTERITAELNHVKFVFPSPATATSLHWAA
jgi:hypothetical protein